MFALWITSDVNWIMPITCWWVWLVRGSLEDASRALVGRGYGVLSLKGADDALERPATH